MSEKIIQHIFQKRRAVQKWVKSNGGTVQDSEDVLQESMIIYLKLLNENKIKDFTEPMQLFFVIAKRYWLNKLRQRKIYIVIDELQLKSDEDLAIEMAIEKEQDYELMEQSLSFLGTKCKELLNLYYFSKLSLDEIAKKLGFRNEKVAKSMKYKCLEKARGFITNAK